MSVFNKLRKVAAAQAIDKAARAAEEFDVFLAGPYIVTVDAADTAINDATDASRLRYFFFHSLVARGHTIYLGEDNELRETGKAEYGPLNNAVLYERHYILNHSDALIALPSSPGSFCEIGDWVSQRDLCEDMLIVVDKKYEGELNYINDGVIKFARTNHATVHYHPYVDKDGVLEICDTFMETIAAKIRIEKLYGRA
ncbi:hypothetical protein [Mesorhizobium sp. BR1-1-14]|uniref:hypothetical protein n=1 Tax=Mesorhizobium sp. BR1-1-14 TaxID=2876655 RepID=UPI001CD070D7|nr:hypothetical protein [Mesorhizobium sp. BR1-1-14]MBZ9960386.1 hypothetical protein [Mesorhizobium sp. BR1-1-14]